MKNTLIEESLKEVIFVRKIAEPVIGEYENKSMCFVLVYYNLLTFIGYPAIYIKDLFVKPKIRGKGAVCQFILALALQTY